jgi:xanthine/CO dehydrogenase XdhC/CoxF family maturation factor
VLHAPAGLDIGADGAEQVATSVVAEIVAVLHGRSGAPLWERPGPIHG